MAPSEDRTQVAGSTTIPPTPPAAAPAATLSLPSCPTPLFNAFSKEFSEVLSTLKATDVNLDMVYSSHLLAALPPALNSLQTTTSVSNPVTLPTTDTLLELIRNEILHSSASPSPTSALLASHTAPSASSPCWHTFCEYGVGPPPGPCLHCREEGHWGHDCPKRARPAPTPTRIPAPAIAGNLAELLDDDGVEAWLASAMLPPPSPRSATLDSGASHIMCGDASLFVNLRRCKPSPMGGIGRTANTLIATGVGSLCIQLRNGRTVIIKNALLVEGLSTILISSGQLWDLHGVASHFAEHTTLTRNGTVVTTGSRTKGLLLASHPLELVHSDVLSVDAASLAGKQYVVTFVDDFSSRLWVEPLDRKSDIFEAFKQFKAAAEMESGHKLQHFRSDNGAEYSSRAFCAYLDEHGVAFQSPLQYSPASNGVAERVNRSILEGIRAMLLQAGADKSLWAEALLAFVFVKNRSPHATLNSKVPLTVWHGRPVRVDMLRVWGCRAWHTLSRTKSKLDARAVPLVFVGYDGDTRAYRLLDPESQRIVRSRDTRFQEDLFPLASAPPPATVDAIAPNPPAALADDSPLCVTVDRDVPLDNDRLRTPAPMEADIPAAPRGVPAVDIPATPPPQPVFVRDAAPSPALPDPIDFLSDPFVAQAVALTAAIEDDIDKAYLHADLNEELYMRVPDGVDGPDWDGKVLKLDHALYSLKQARRAWNAKIHATLEHLRYCRTISDICVYVRCEGGNYHYIALYVGDLLFLSHSQPEIDRVKGGLREQYGIKDLGDASCILGIDLVLRPDGSVFLSQRAYLETVFARLGQAECHTATTPMIPNQQLIPAPPDFADDPSL
ncbi:hypothetical protein JCM1841_005335 [Sporobolomyces salmonicolor]